MFAAAVLWHFGARRERARALGANNCCPYNNSKTEDAQCVCVCFNRAHGAEMFMSHRALQNGSGRTADGLHSLWTGALESVLACERIYCTDNDDGRSQWRRQRRQRRAPCQALATFGGSINVRGKVKNRSLATTVNEPRAFVRVCVLFLLQLLDVLKKDRTLRAVHSKPSRCLFARRRVRCSRAKAKGESQRVQKICTVDISLQIVQCARAGVDGGGGTET